MKLKKILLPLLVILFSFFVIIYFGKDYLNKIEDLPRAVATHHELLFTHEDIKEGQQIWHSLGIVNTSSKDWFKEWNAKESSALLNIWANKDLGKDFSMLDSEQQEFYRSRLEVEFSKSFIDEDGRLSLSADRAKAIKELSHYYETIFSKDERFQKINNPESLKKIMAYFFWSTWTMPLEKKLGHPQGGN